MLDLPIRQVLRAVHWCCKTTIFGLLLSYQSVSPKGAKFGEDWQKSVSWWTEYPPEFQGPPKCAVGLTDIHILQDRMYYNIIQHFKGYQGCPWGYPSGATWAIITLRAVFGLTFHHDAVSILSILRAFLPGSPHQNAMCAGCQIPPPKLSFSISGL